MPRKTTADNLLDVAADAFALHGYFGTRVSDVARNAGVAQGTVYLHFASKERLYEAVLERFAEMVRRLSAGIRWEDIRSTADLHDRFADLYGEVFELCARNRGVAGLLLSGPPVGHSGEIRARLFSDAEQISVAYLEAGATAGLLRPVPAATVARAIVGLLVHTAATTIVAEGRTSRLGELVDELLDFELYGLVGPAQAPNHQGRSPTTNAPVGTALHAPEV